MNVRRLLERAYALRLRPRARARCLNEPTAYARPIMCAYTEAPAPPMFCMSASFITQRDRRPRVIVDEAVVEKGKAKKVGERGKGGGGERGAFE